MAGTPTRHQYRRAPLTSPDVHPAGQLQCGSHLISPTRHHRLGSMAAVDREKGLTGRKVDCVQLIVPAVENPDYYLDLEFSRR